MSWHGAAPDPSGFAPKLPPGTHTVSIVRLKRTRDGDYLAILADERGRECVANVPEDINPETNEKKAWLFYRLVGAFDMPTPMYWDTPIEEREARTWDVERDIEQIIAEKTTAIVKIETYNGKSSLKDIWSPRRAKAADAEAMESEVPF